MIFRHLFLLTTLLFISCNRDIVETNIPLESYVLEDGFQLRSIAAEPLLVAPVVMDFDNKGRIWVAEMNGYMNNMEGRGEDAPLGSIKILEDRDRDGVMDHAIKFLDNLTLPRAIAHVYGGLLYAEPPNLWFVEIENDKPGNRILVDSLYAPDGNPEHQPNGLMMNVDNWIYNAKSHFRYRQKNGKWLKEPTTFRGQWGITHDNFGRLYFNDNSGQLLGDYLLPNRSTRNKFLKPRYGVNKLLTKDQRVYPLHASLVNRGYAEGILDGDSLLVDVTAACAPLVYRGGKFPTGYDQNVFVCVPEANLIKRNVLQFHGDSTNAYQAWQGKEFLASTDIGFRPVSLNNGPDGAMYIVDMHRGVIGHHAYLSPYFKKKAREKLLDTIIGRGRILKIQNESSSNSNSIVLESAKDEELLGFLNHSNGWVSDRSQQLLIARGNLGLKDSLVSMLRTSNNEVAQIHALYTLEGMDALDFNLLIDLANQGDDQLASHAIVLLETFVNSTNTNKFLDLGKRLLEEKSLFKDVYFASSLGVWASYSKELTLPLLLKYSLLYKDNPIVSEAIVSGSTDILDEYKKSLDENNFETTSLLYQMLLESIQNKEDDILNPIYVSNGLNEDSRTKGAKIFRQICAACHGINGEGNEGLAPPLVHSNYVSEPIERMALIILNGLKGPIHVNGELYEMNQAMPGLKNNETLSDEDIADVITYVSNAFADNPVWISADRIRELRKLKSRDGNEYTEEELLELSFQE
ncbi:c-type cytochrome [Maribacter litopenaei]|uniref:C-type cytochrome n=1 Tax=Maribacter litopenaei TaxID=2976127 RepID=A0ABY5YA76_9FLAO|nr:c-type cytochrome [Maribacter litopenaei]UWX55960.1 c-type cytochrome [Maribacter litopenaei]